MTSIETEKNKVEGYTLLMSVLGFFCILFFVFLSELY